MHTHKVLSGPLIFTSDKIRPVLSLAPHFKSLADSTGGELVVFFAFMKAPSMPAVHPATLVFYDGPESEARSLLAPVYDLGPVVRWLRP